MPPFKLKEARELKERDIPEFVYDAINLLIARHIGNGKHASFTKDQAVAMILEKAPDGIDRGTIFANYWLDFESAYRKIGWEVRYDQPGFNETYEAKWYFHWKGNDHND